MDISEFLLVLAQVVAIDLVLAGDNALVVGMAAAAVPLPMRRRAIVLGIAAAALLRIVFAVSTTHLLSIIGLTLAGGLLLLWVCWKLYRELREGAGDAGEAAAAAAAAAAGTVSVSAAMWKIVIADVSMSLDNVLAVAGAAHDHPAILVGGLALSVLLMGVAAEVISRLLGRHRWIGWLGLAVITYVALEMIWRGGNEVFPHLAALL